ncbi:MAG: hypothetical protein HYS12_22865 [Planctomycetes bacterium]|nr:hypothetical protein [Planctomycetota bacterium]
MKRALWVVCVGVLACLGAAGSRAEDKDSKEVVELDGLKATVPADWKKEQPKSNLRYAQFRVPRAEGDDADAELVIFKGLGGTVKQNVDRWKASFIPPEGKTIDDVSTLQKRKVAGFPATYLDVRGTYRDGVPGSTKVTKRPGYRMLAVQVDGDKNPYHFKLTGPAKTIEKHKKEFDKWLESFK